MSDPTVYLAVLAVAIAGLCIATAAVLKGWQGWLEIKRLEIAHGRGRHDPAGPSPAARIEIADLKERVRKLEAIATGVDL